MTVVLSLWILAGGSIFSRKIWSYLPTPLLFILAALLFFVLIDLTVLRQLYAIIISLVYLLITKNIHSFLYHTKEYQPYALENIYSYVNLTSLFLYYAAFYGTILFLGWPSWLLTAMAVIITAFLYMRTLWSYKIEWKKSKLYIAVAAIVLGQSFYIIGSLPTSFLFNALILSLIYYLYMNISKDYLRNIISTKKIRQYVYISAAIGVISIATVRWY